MDEYILGSVKNFFASLGADVIFLVVAGLIAAAFAALYIPYRLQKNGSRKYPRAFLLLTAGFLLAETAALGGSGALALFLPLSAALGVFFYVPFAFFPAGKIKAKKAEKRLIDLIDKEIKKSGEFPAAPPARTQLSEFKNYIKAAAENVEKEESPAESKPQILKCKPVKKEKACEIDFKHVKNIIERLEYYNLNASEKRQVKDLQYAVQRAESGESLPDDAAAVNDGLGALLKIMAKYGV